MRVVHYCCCLFFIHVSLTITHLLLCYQFIFNACLSIELVCLLIVSQYILNTFMFMVIEDFVHIVCSCLMINPASCVVFLGVEVWGDFFFCGGGAF